MAGKKCILIFIILLYMTLYDSTDANVNKTCSSSKQTLTCNYVPEEIPDGVQNVNIKDFALETLFDLHNELFRSNTWKNVKSLDFDDDFGDRLNLVHIRNKTFMNLQELKVLRMSCRTSFQIEPDAFKGLDKIKQLDFSGCTRLDLAILMKYLNGSDKVPNLEQLILSGIYNIATQGIHIDRTFSRCLAGKPLKIIDLSRTHISLFDCSVLTDLNHLIAVNLSRAIVDKRAKNCNPDPSFHGLDVDLSYSTINGAYISLGIHTYANLNIVASAKNISLVATFILSTRSLNLTALNEGPEILLYNIKIWAVDSINSIYTKELILKQNNLKWFDVRIDCNNIDASSIEILDVSENGMEYIHPSLIACLSGIKHLDLSANNLNAMRMEDVDLFGQLLNRSKQLQYINLASNMLVDIPVDFFKGSNSLVTINLSGNRLTQVHFELHHLKQLLFIDLSRNAIKIFDSVTMEQLDALMIDLEPNIVDTETKKMTSIGRYTSGNRHVRVSGNPFSCGTCETLSSIRWLVSAHITEPVPDQLTCKDERGKNIDLNDAVEAVQEVCERVMKIIVSTVTSFVVIFIIVGIVLLIYFRRKRTKQQQRRNNVIELLRQDEEYFALFLSFCNEDVEFVTENVIGPLNEGLQRLVGTDRNLVCLGDSEFRLGQYVHNESLRCIELSTVFLCLVSDSYCNSRYCVEEFDQATQRKYEQFYTRSLDQRMYTNTLLGRIKASSRIMCASWCQITPSCQDFTFHQNGCKVYGVEGSAQPFKRIELFVKGMLRILMTDIDINTTMQYVFILQ
ncbi:tRNA-dihydrouridine(20) synthase [NAD(P)+]-like protein [Mactra antiquata]